MTEKYAYPIVENDDYVELKNYEGWWKITDNNPTSFSCIDDWGTILHYLPYNEITDLKLPSEMDYAF